MNDDTSQTLRSVGDMVASLLDGLTELLNSLRRTGHADAGNAESLVGLAIEAGQLCGQLELAEAGAQAALVAQDAIRRASGGGA